MKRFLITNLICLILIFTGCNNKKEEKDFSQSTPVKVKTMKIQYSFIPDFLTITGNTKSNKTVILSPKINGFIKKINFAEGAFVKQGDIVAIIDNKETVNKLKSLKENLAAAKLNIIEAKKMIEINKKSLKQAISNYDYAQKTFNRYKNLLKSESITKQEFDKVKNNYTNSKLEYEKAVKSLEISKFKLAQTKKEFQALKNSVNAMKVITNYRFIKSKISGIVLKKYVDEGNFINVGMPVLQIGTIEKQGFFHIPFKYFNKVHIGDAVFIKNKIFKITNKSPNIGKKSSQFLIKVDLEKNFINGEYLEGKIQIGKRKTIVIDSKYINKYDDLNYTFIAKDNRIIKVYLMVKQLTDTKYEIISGLNAGDLLIIEPLGKLKDNYPCIITSTQ